MANDGGVIDLWVQWLAPTAPGANPAGENVFRNYGRLDVYHSGTSVDLLLREMDAAGVDKVLLAGSDNEKVAAAVRAHPDRILGNYHADPTNIMAAVRGLDRAVKEWGFRCRTRRWTAPTRRPCGRPAGPCSPRSACARSLPPSTATRAGTPGPRRPATRRTTRARHGRG